MWSISINFISGFMVGVEFVTKEQSGGTAAFIVDLGIIRFGLYHDDEFGDE